ncbi:YhbP family protein [Providencia vermicola]|uniref:YhbP family protein n=1 Tax=Providencia vermicola TaxID=333965 RepID=UPI00220A0B35|nr:YhbP family protein [Providencia stuartii]
MTPEQTLKHIQRYIARQHVFSLFTHHHNDIWPASCYYAFDAKTMSLILMTDPNSKHGQLIAANPQVAGTISAQTKAVNAIQGIQFIGEIEKLEGEVEQQARNIYCRRFPVALSAKLPVWQLHLARVKMVDNKLGFGTKLHWTREA